MTNLIIIDGFLGPLYLTGGFAAAVPDTPPSADADSPLYKIIAAMEKTSVSKCYIDYRFIDPGLADWTPLDERLK